MPALTRLGEWFRKGYLLQPQRLLTSAAKARTNLELLDGTAEADALPKPLARPSSIPAHFREHAFTVR